MCITTALTVVVHSLTAQPFECLQSLLAPRYILTRWLPMLSTLRMLRAPYAFFTIYITALRLYCGRMHTPLPTDAHTQEITLGMHGLLLCDGQPHHVYFLYRRQHQADSERSRKYHNPKRRPLVRIGPAPCNFYYISKNDNKKTANRTTLGSGIIS